jgi:hypothetical protein
MARGEFAGRSPFGLRAALLPLSPGSHAGVGPGQTFPAGQIPQEAIRRQRWDMPKIQAGRRRSHALRQQGCLRKAAARLPAVQRGCAHRPRPLHQGDNRHPRLCCIWRFFWHLCGIPRTMQKTFLQDRLDALGAGAGRLAGVRRNGSDVWVLSFLSDGAPQAVGYSKPQQFVSPRHHFNPIRS